MRLLLDILNHPPFSDLFDIAKPRSQNQFPTISLAKGTPISDAVGSLANVVAIQDDAELVKRDAQDLRLMAQGTRRRAKVLCTRGDGAEAKDLEETTTRLEADLARADAAIAGYTEDRKAHMTEAREALALARVEQPAAVALLLTLAPPNVWDLVNEALGTGT